LTLKKEVIGGCRELHEYDEERCPYLLEFPSPYSVYRHCYISPHFPLRVNQELRIIFKINIIMEEYSVH
jgi:hypothetical protein